MERLIEEIPVDVLPDGDLHIMLMLLLRWKDFHLARGGMAGLIKSNYLHVRNLTLSDRMSTGRLMRDLVGLDSIGQLAVRTQLREAILVTRAGRWPPAGECRECRRASLSTAKVLFTAASTSVHTE